MLNISMIYEGFSEEIGGSEYSDIEAHDADVDADSGRLDKDTTYFLQELQRVVSDLQQLKDKENYTMDDVKVYRALVDSYKDITSTLRASEDPTLKSIANMKQDIYSSDPNEGISRSLYDEPDSDYVEV